MNATNATDSKASERFRAARVILGQDQLSQVQRNNIRHARNLSTLLFTNQRLAREASDDVVDEAFLGRDADGGIHVLAVEGNRPVVKRFADDGDDDPVTKDLLAVDQDVPTYLAYVDECWGWDELLVPEEMMG